MRHIAATRPRERGLHCNAGNPERPDNLGCGRGRLEIFLGLDGIGSQQQLRYYIAIEKV